MIEKKFQEIIKKEEKVVEDKGKSFKLLGILRILVFAFIIYFAYRYVKEPVDLYFYFLLLSIAVFIVLIIYHIKIKDQLNYSKSIIKVNKRYLDRINGRWTEFSDKGEEFIDKEHRYSSDLDIVGERSLFQLINLTGTFYGRKILAKDLLEAGYTKEEIYRRQEAIKELEGKLYFCEELEVKAKDDKIKNPEKMINFFNSKDKNYSKTIMNFLKFLPLIVILSSAAIVLLKYEKLYKFVFFLFTAQIILWLIGMSKNNQILGNVGYLSSSLENYLDILKLIEKESFKSELLKNIKNDLFSSQASVTGIKKLQNIVQRISIRSNGLLYLLFNILFLWDYQIAFSLEDWRNRFGVNVESWLRSIGEIESLMSFSVLLQIEKDLAFPSINEDEPKIEASSLGHPLISAEERINNDISIEDQILIITGSNMSGKTTFLRTIGINIVLARAGAPSFSRAFSLPIMDIYTSMRITDDLKNKISTFYGELLRIKDILDYGKIHKNTFFLIDEIFRGTNSKDSIYGAKNVLRNLNNEGLMGAITTHDIELCALDKEKRIVNYNFSEDYIEGKINFDYKIRKGQSTSTNAKHLMELVGIELLKE